MNQFERLVVTNGAEHVAEFTFSSEQAVRDWLVTAPGKLPPNPDCNMCQGTGKRRGIGEPCWCTYEHPKVSA